MRVRVPPPAPTKHYVPADCFTRLPAWFDSTAYIAGRVIRGQDIRLAGDGNMEAGNVFRELGAAAGFTVAFIDILKGALAVLIAQNAGMNLPVVMSTGAAAVLGHNFPVFLGFRGRRGESTVFGELLVLLPYPLLFALPSALVVLALSRNFVFASACLFIPMVIISMWIKIPWHLIAYSIGLLLIVATTHWARTRLIPAKIAVKPHEKF